MVAIGSTAALTVAVLMGSCSTDDSHLGSDADAGTVEAAKEADAAAHDRHDGPIEAEPGTDGDASPDQQSDELPSEQRWVAEPTNWMPVIDTGLPNECAIEEAYPDKIGFPALQWAPCGNGCQVADVAQGYGLATQASASTWNEAAIGVGYFVAHHGLETSSTKYQVRRLIRLDDGATVAALKYSFKRGDPAPCVFSWRRETAMVTTVSSRAPNVYDVTATAAPGAPWVWGRPALDVDAIPAALMDMDMEDGRRIFRVGKNSVSAQMDPASSVFTILESPSGSDIGSAQGDLAVWTDYAEPGNPTVRGWAPDGKAVRTIVSGLPEETCWLAVTPSHLVGLMGVESQDWRCSAPLDSAHLWTTARAYEASGAVLTTSPPLPGTPFTASLKAWGQFAALVVTPVDYYDAGGWHAASGGHILVVQLSTWKMWRLEWDQGWVIYPEAFAITPTDLYVGLRQIADDFAQVRRVVRYELGKLGEFASPLN